MSSVVLSFGVCLVESVEKANTIMMHMPMIKIPNAKQILADVSTELEKRAELSLL